MEHNDGRSPSDSGETEFRTWFSADVSTAYTVIEALAAVNGVEPDELDRLYGSVDPDALDKLFEKPVRLPDQRDLHVEFTASGCRVIVRDDGGISVLESGNDR